MVPRVLVCDPISQEAIDLLKQKGYHIDFIRSPKPEELKKIVEDYDVLIVRSATKVTAEVIERAHRLKIIGRPGAGLDNIDLAKAREKGIIVVNTPNALSISVAELTIGLMLMLARNLFTACESMKRGAWIKHKLKGFELYGKTLGVIGLGNVGSEVAIRAKALGMRVLGYRRTRLLETAKRLGVTACSFEELLRESDFITIHVPLTPETFHMISEREFNMMKEGVFLINTSRGAVVDGRSLLKALETGKVAGAALDVFENEPPKEEWEFKLIGHPRVIATPHIGSMTLEAQKRAGLMLVRKIIEILSTDSK